MEEELRNTVEATDQNAQYDACAKRILGNKQILAHIIKAAIPGFQDMKPSEIIPYIEGEPLIGNVRIEPGLTNPSMSEVISGMNTEDTDRSEGKIYFDVLFLFIGRNRPQQSHHQRGSTTERRCWISDHQPGHILWMQECLFPKRKGVCPFQLWRHQEGIQYLGMF